MHFLPCIFVHEITYSVCLSPIVGYTVCGFRKRKQGTHAMKLKTALALAALLAWGAVQLLAMVQDATSIGLVR